MRAALLAATWIVCARATNAQVGTGTGARIMFVNDEWERYARVLQLTGNVTPYPWSVREFGVREMAFLAPKDSAHPWSAVSRGSVRVERGAVVQAIPAQVAFVYNSAFPFGYNDGAVWAGRGLTTMVQGGATVTAAALSVVVDPVLFRAENASFALRDNGQGGIYAFGAPYEAHKIDEPQRFGAGAYARLDPGNSSARIDLGPAAFGFSSAPMHWGPARDHPILMGNNAPGFAHLFLGSSRPLDLKLVTVHGRMIWARLYETPYVKIHDTQPGRLASGIVGSITMRGAPGLEIGAGRFTHMPWSRAGLTMSNLTLPLQGVFVPNTSAKATDAVNELASVFGRWAFPGAGLEVYGELGRDDHAANLRDLETEPDHSRAYLVGFQRVLGKDSGSRTVLRGEVLNSRTSGLVLRREQTQWYTHLPVAQGHTNLGQVLGSIGAFGGGASTLAWDRYTPAGRWTISWSRIMRGEDIAYPSGQTNPEHADVQHALSVNGLRFRGRLALTWEATYVRELNRDLTHDATNLRLSTGATYAW